MLALSQGGESQLNPEGKRGTERGAKGRAGGSGLHRINRDSVLARPVRDRRIQYARRTSRAKTCAANATETRRKRLPRRQNGLKWIPIGVENRSWGRVITEIDAIQRKRVCPP